MSFDCSCGHSFHEYQRSSGFLVKKCDLKFMRFKCKPQCCSWKIIVLVLLPFNIVESMQCYSTLSLRMLIPAVRYFNVDDIRFDLFLKIDKGPKWEVLNITCDKEISYCFIALWFRFPWVWIISHSLFHPLICSPAPLCLLLTARFARLLRCACSCAPFEYVSPVEHVSSIL